MLSRRLSKMDAYPYRIANMFGARLRQARFDRGWTAEKAAAEAKIEQVTLWRYETERHRPTAEILHRLAQAYGRDMEWFWQEGDDMITTTALTPIKMSTVSILGTVSAGGLVESWQVNLGSLEVPSYMLREAPRAFALRVSGSSLVSDGIFDGDLVVVDPDAPFVDGKIYAVRSEENNQTIAARKVYEAGRRVYKLVSGDGEVTEVQRSRTTLLGRIRWSFREH